jgi:hypothetical protein
MQNGDRPMSMPFLFMAFLNLYNKLQKKYMKIQYLGERCVSPTRKPNLKFVHQKNTHGNNCMRCFMITTLHPIMLGQLNHEQRDEWDMEKQEIRKNCG